MRNGGRQQKKREKRKKKRSEGRKKRTHLDDRNHFAFRNQFNFERVLRAWPRVRSIEKSYRLTGSALIQMEEEGKSVFIVNAVNEIDLFD